MLRTVIIEQWDAVADTLTLRRYRVRRLSEALNKQMTGSTELAVFVSSCHFLSSDALTFGLWRNKQWSDDSDEAAEADDTNSKYLKSFTVSQTEITSNVITGRSTLICRSIVCNILQYKSIKVYLKYKTGLCTEPVSKK